MRTSIISTSLYRFDEKLIQRYKVIAGVDEAGRGSLAGPVVAAAVILPRRKKIHGINDSKKLSPKTREELYQKIIDVAIAWATGVATDAEIDEKGILNATFKAARQALKKITSEVNLVIFDGNIKIPRIRREQLCVISGDQKSACVAAASIVAKVTRDRLMREYGSLYPSYEFSRHKGYGTARHIELLNRFGPSPIHRISFSPLWALQRQ